MKIKKCALAVTGLLVIGSCLYAKSNKTKELPSKYSDYEVTDVDKKMQSIANANNETYGEHIVRTLTKFESSDKYYEYDETSIFIRGSVSNIKKQNAVVVTKPQDEQVGFGSPYMLAYYYFLLGDAERQEFIKAVDTYFDDFANKKLSRKNKSSYKVYGKHKARIEWGSAKLSVKKYADTSAYFGYDFYKKSPYFTITVYPVEDQNIDFARSSTTNLETSMNIRYCLTKAQAQTLKEMFSDETIKPLYAQYEAAVRNKLQTYTENVSDDYSEEY